MIAIIVIKKHNSDYDDNNDNDFDNSSDDNI